MTIHIAPFDPHPASEKLWAALNDTRRAIAAEFWRDEPILDDAETRREIQTHNPMLEFRRWVAMEGEEVAGWVRVDGRLSARGRIDVEEGPGAECRQVHHVDITVGRDGKIVWLPKGAARGNHGLSAGDGINAEDGLRHRVGHIDRPIGRQSDTLGNIEQSAGRDHR